MQKIKIKDLKPHPDNPRVISEKDREKLRQSMEDDPEFLEVRTVIIDADNYIICGHQKVDILREKGYSEITVDQLGKNWTEDEKRELMVKDNVHYGMFDWGIIRKQSTENELIQFGLLDEIQTPKPKEDKEYEPSYVVTLPVRAEIYDEVKSKTDSMRDQAINVAQIIEQSLA